MSRKRQGVREDQKRQTAIRQNREKAFMSLTKRDMRDKETWRKETGREGARVEWAGRDKE